jgi:hypothetical protein
MLKTEKSQFDLRQRERLSLSLSLSLYFVHRCLQEKRMERETEGKNVRPSVTQTAGEGENDGNSELQPRLVAVRGWGWVGFVFCFVDTTGNIRQLM